MVSQFSVEGKSAIVTGAGSGINYHLASLLLSKGCNVMLADINLRPEAQELLKKFAKGTPSAAFVKTDVTDWAQLRRVFDTAFEKFPDIDIVVPGAGVFEPHWSNFWHPPGTEASKDALDAGHYATLDINLIHPIRVSQLALSYFLSPSKATGTKASAVSPKRIVHISSVAGQTASLICPLYASSKHAISAFVRSLGALEDTLNIRVNCVAPGLVLTPLWIDHPEKMPLISKENVWVTPEEVAEAMLDLIQDDRYPGGTILEVGHQERRIVPMLMNPGPSTPSTKASGGAANMNEVYEWLGADNWGRPDS